MRTLYPLFSVLAFSLLLTAGCQTPPDEYQRAASDPEHVHASVDRMTDVMVHDIFSPPQASRAYAYASVAAYEALQPAHGSHQSLAGQLNELTAAPAPDTSQEHVFPLASVHAFLTVGRAMVFTEDRLAPFHDEMLARYRDMGIPRGVYERSITYGDAVAQHVLAWAANDHYSESRSAPKYTVTDEPGRWRPTPPAYLDGVEPNWNMLRPFVIQSADQFKPTRPYPYSMEEGTEFYRQVQEVYEIGRDLSAEEREIASFWDCNPYTMHTRGHAMFATKKLTPGGHWMGIAAIASRQTDADLMRTVESYARVAVALADGFISAWDEKYRSNLVRPETVINDHIDESWTPLLQTPPFPEYPSAHSVISAAAAVALTELYGEPFAFDDTTEVRYGLPVRSFDSFMEAAEEAAISRLYGGIHYRMAAERGTDQGRELGTYAWQRVMTQTQPQLAATQR